MFNEIVLVTFYIAILLYSIIIHEISHGMMAFWLGDPTAKYAGRLSANPLKHIDPWLTIGMPLLLLLLSNFQFAFGGAKPVPYNPYNLKNQKWGPALVGLAGPGANIILALIAAILAKLIAIPLAIKMEIAYNFNNWEKLSHIVAGSVGAIFFELMIMIIFWNVLLAFFNLIPIPPLDGSKLLFSIFPVKIETMALMERYGLIFLLFIVIFFAGPIGMFLNLMFNLFLRMTF